MQKENLLRSNNFHVDIYFWNPFHSNMNRKSYNPGDIQRKPPLKFYVQLTFLWHISPFREKFRVPQDRYCWYLTGNNLEQLKENNLMIGIPVYLGASHHLFTHCHRNSFTMMSFTKIQILFIFRGRLIWRLHISNWFFI